MYRQKISKKNSSPVKSTAINKDVAPNQSYGSLSSVVQRAQQDVNSLSGDERQQLESAIGTKATGEVLTGKQWVPEFKGISGQLWDTVPVQAKLTIGRVGDKYEREADRVAKDVVQRISTPVSKLQQKPQENAIASDSETPSSIVRQHLHLQTQRKTAISGTAPPNLERDINHAKSGGQPISSSLQQKMSSAMGADFSRVKIHTDTRADQLNRSIQARAFTAGGAIFFRKGAYNPYSKGSQELIAHELTHVMQQNDNLVTRKSQLIQRDTVQDEDDANFDYGEYIESDINKKVILKKKKIFYQHKGSTPYKDSKGKNRVLEKGTLVELLEPSSSNGFFSRSWANIEAKGRNGWINTKNSVTPAKNGIVAHEPAGIIMPNNPTVEDVKQNMFGDCFLLAALMSLVQNDPEFIKESLFKTDPTKDTDKHTVCFHKFANYDAMKLRSELKFEKEEVTVNNTILKVKTTIKKPNKTIKANTPVGSKGKQPWPAIIEKAFAKFPKDSLPDSRGLDGGHGDTASMILTGKGYESISPAEEGIAYEHRQMVEEGRAKNVEEAKEIIVNENKEVSKARIINAFTYDPLVSTLKTAATRHFPPKEWLKNNPAEGKGGSGEYKAGGIAFQHVYSIVAADKHEIHLRNPWGEYSRVRGKIRRRKAVSILTWDEFYQVVSSVSLKA